MRCSSSRATRRPDCSRRCSGSPGCLARRVSISVRGIAVSPDGKSVYLTTRSPLASGAQGISVFARDTGTGMLTFLEIQREGVGGVSGLYDPRAVVVSGDGLNVYARSRSALATFARNATTGALTFVGAETYDTVISAGSGGIVISPDGAQLYTVDDKVVLMYARAPGTGVLSFLGTVENGVDGVSGINTPRNLAISPDGQNVYVVSVGTFEASNDDFTVLARDAWDRCPDVCREASRVTAAPACEQCGGRSDRPAHRTSRARSSAMPRSDSTNGTVGSAR